MAASAIGRPVEIRAYADRIELRQDGRLVGEHRRAFGRDQTIFDPWHYVPVSPASQAHFVTARRSRIGFYRPRLIVFDASSSPPMMATGRWSSDGLQAVEAACAEALYQGVHSADVILNILARRRELISPVTIMTPERLRLRHEPMADCARYDGLRRTS